MDSPRSIVARLHLRGWQVALGVAAGVVLALCGFLLLSPRAEFVFGGALVNAGYRLQDHLEDYDLAHHHLQQPREIWNEALRQNRMASSVRNLFPRSTHHPLVAIVACMDARIDTNELVGDTRKYYYVIRTAGSVLGQREEEMLELAVENGVKVVLFTTHSECAAERVASNPATRARYPELSAGVDERERRIAEFLARPAIASRVSSGALLIRRALINTRSGELIPSPD